MPTGETVDVKVVLVDERVVVNMANAGVDSAESVDVCVVLLALGGAVCVCAWCTGKVLKCDRRVGGSCGCLCSCQSLWAISIDEICG